MPPGATFTWSPGSSTPAGESLAAGLIDEDFDGDPRDDGKPDRRTGEYPD